MRRSRRRGSGEAQELNVTCFMNLMVVLVPFLLMSAVFSEITVHELNLPAIAEHSAAKGERPKLALEVVIRRDALDVLDRNSGRLKLIPNVASRHDFSSLSEKLQQIKAAYPESSDITLLLEPEVPYEHLISTMDVVRKYDVQQNGKMLRRDLFPDVSIGDAPLARKDGAAK